MPLYVFDNHDRPRSWDRYGDGKNDARIAKMIAAILLALRASALVYQGQEIGMVTTTPARKEDVRNPRGIAGWPKEKGRDGERTPMQWDAGRSAGFSTAPRPWLPIPASYVGTNVAAQAGDPQSLLAWYSKLIGLRRSSPALRDGGIVLLDRDAQHTLALVRRGTSDANGTAAIVVACNMSAKPVVLDLQADLGKVVGAAYRLRPVMSSAGPTAPVRPNRITLAPYATLIAEIAAAGSNRAGKAGRGQ